MLINNPINDNISIKNILQIENDNVPRQLRLLSSKTAIINILNQSINEE